MQALRTSAIFEQIHIKCSSETRSSHHILTHQPRNTIDTTKRNMSAMESINGTTEAVTNGTTNGTPSASTNLAPNTAKAMEKQHTQISHISGDLSNSSHCKIRGIITLLWPYSSLTKSLALNLAEKDVRLRTNKGQVKISFTGELGKHVGAQGLNIDDELILSLVGAEIVKTQPRDSRDVGYELRYTKKLVGRITSRPNGDVVLDHEAQDEVAIAPVIPVQTVVEIPSPARSPPRSRVGAIQNEDGEWASPAFIKRARLSYGSLMSEEFDAIIGEDGTIPGKGRKKAKFEPRKSGTWRYQSESRSPSPEPEAEEDTQMKEVEPEKSKAVMMEQGCQTDDLEYDDAEVQEFFRRSQAIGREVRQDERQHIIEGVQTVFGSDHAEMFSPITFPAPITTPFGKPPVPLFGQTQPSTTPFGEPPVQALTTPFGAPTAQMSTTPSEPLPEQYQPLVSPLASRSTAPVHEEGQWPASLFETMGYKPNTFSKSTTSSTFAQSTNLETLSPVKPTSFSQGVQDDNDNSAALALEELSKIHHAQQVEDAMVDYDDPAKQVLQGSLNEVVPALSPPKQSEYHGLLEHEFLTPAKPNYGSRHQSPQYQSQPRQGAISYPAERYSRERSGTPQHRQQSPMPTTSPFQGPGSQGVRAQSETIDLTGESDDEDEGQEEEYSEDEQEQVMPGESFEETRDRLLNEPDSEEEEGSGVEDEENMTEVRIPSWRGQPQRPSMIPKSREYVDEEDDLSGEEEMHSVEGGEDEEGQEYEGEDDDERMSEGYDFSRRGIVLNPLKPRVLGDRTTEGMNAVQDELDEDAEGDYDSDERPPSLKEQFSDDDGDAENYGEEYDDDEEDIQSDLDPGPIDPDDAIMPGEDTEQSWDEEEEEEREEEDLEHDEEQWEGQEARDIGPAYGQSANNSRSQSSGPPEVIDLLSSDEDEPAPPKKAAAPASPPPAPTQDHQQAIQPDDSSDGDQDMESGSEHSDEQLDVEGEEQLSEAESGHENATEIAEQEREVYDEEQDDSSRQSIQSQEDRMSPAPQNVEDAQAAAEGSGYEDEDATAEEIQSPRDMVGMDGGWESKPVKDTPKKSLFQPLTQSSPVKAAEELPLPEKIESVEPPAQKEGEDADIEDAEFEVPKENFDEVEKVTPVDPALLAGRDEDRPVEATSGRPRQGAHVEAMDEHVPQTATSSPIKAKSDDAVKKLATAALMAERDEDRPVQATETSIITSTLTKSSPVKQARSPQLESSSPAAKAQLAAASLMAERDEDRPVQASQSTTNATPKKDAEAALLACEQKLDQEMDEELRVSKDQELTEEAEHDIEMAEVITSPAKTEERKAIEDEIDQDVRMAESSEHQGDTSVARAVEPGPRGDPEDVEMDGDVRSTDGGLEASSPAPFQHEQHGTVKSTVEPGPRGDPEDIEMDGDIRPSDGSLEAASTAPSQHNDGASQDAQIEPRSDDIVPEVVISEVSSVAFDVEEQDRDEDDYEDPSSQLFEEMNYIEQAEEINTLVVEESQGSDRQSFVSQTTQKTEVATQKSEMASVFSEEVTETAVTSFQTLPVSAQLVEDQEKAQDIEGDMEEQEVESMEVEDASKDAPAPAADESVPVDIEEHPATHTRSHDKQPKSSPAKTQAVPEPITMKVDEHLASQARPHDKHKASPKVERAGSPAAHIRSHDAAGECVEDDNAARPELQPSPKQADVQDVEMQSIEEDEHPAAHTRSHDKRVEKLQKSDRSGSPAEHTRSHDALAGHCVEDDESAKGLQRTTRRKSSSRKSTEQPSEHTTPSKSAPEPAVEPVVEVPVTSSAVENVQETPPKRVTRSRRGTQESVASPPKTRKRALTPVIEVPLSSNPEEATEPAESESSPQQLARATRSSRGTQESVKPASPPKTRKRALSPVVEVPVSSIEEAEAAPAEPKPAPEPPKRVTRARSGSAQPVLNSPPKTRTKRQSSLEPIIEVPASSIIENVQEESVAAASPSQRATRARKASIQSAPKATTPPRTRRMSARSQASPDTTNMSEISGSMVLKAIDEEDDELPDPGAAAILEYDDSPRKPASKTNVTSAPAPARNLRGKRNERVELKSSGQAIPETPVKTRTRALRGQAQAQESSQPAEAESTSPADPQTPANKATTSTRTPLVSPSQWDTLTPQAVAAQITKTLRTQLPAYTPLKNIKNHLKKKIDVLAVCVATPEAATKGNKTPHDYVLKFFVTEPGSSGTVKEVTAFHHFKKCLPVMCAGNVVLLRNFLVDGQNNGCLRSEKDSSWAVWRKDDQEPEMNNVVPLEFEGGEDEYAKQLKLWWEEKVEAEQKDKMKAIAEKGKAKK